MHHTKAINIDNFTIIEKITIVEIESLSNMARGAESSKC